MFRVHIQGHPDHMAVGTNNAIVIFRATQKEDDTNNNNIQGDVTSDIVILSDKNEVKCKYKCSPGESSFITVGNNCDIVEIAINPELEQKLKETGEFQVTKGDKLVSIRWKNDDNWSNDDETYSEWKIRFTKDGEKVDTQKLEKEIFENMVDENNNGLRDLVGELIAIFNAKLQHIESGCIQLVLSTQSQEDVRHLEQKKDELKALLHRTIIPESIEIELEFQHSDLSSEQDDLDKESPVAAEHQMLPKDSQESPSLNKVDIHDEIVKPERANRVLSRFFDKMEDSTNSSTVDPIEKTMVEKRSIKRSVGSQPPLKEIKPFNFATMAATERSSSRQLMNARSVPIISPESVDIRVPVTAPILFEREQGIQMLEIINEENPGSSRTPESTDFEVATRSSAGPSSLAISGTSVSTSSSRNLPTLYSAIKGNEDVQYIATLLETTVDLDAKDNTGNTALHLAVQCSNTAVVQLLLERNAQIDCANSNLDRPLHLACLANKLDIVALLLENNAPKHSQNIDGDTPLHLAIRFGFMETIDLLLQQKLRFPDKKNNIGDTYLHSAARYGISTAVYKLVQAGVSVDLPNENSETPLLVAVKAEKLAAAKVLIDNNANVNCVDQHGDSPLHIATSRFMDDIAHLLLDQPDIDVNIYNNERYTPAFHARGEIRRRLMAAGSSTRKGWVCLMM